MKSTQAFLILSLAVSASSALAQQTRQFSRSAQDLDSCIAKYQPLLGIGFTAEAERVCANYTNANLDCAVNIRREYGVTQHQQAIRVCLLKYKDAKLNRCTLDAMGETRTAGRAVDVNAIIDRCQSPPPPPTRQAETYNPPVSPRPMNPPSYPYDPAPVQQRPTPPLTTHVYPTRTLIEKINYAKFVKQVSTWLKMPEGSISDVQMGPYFNLVNSMLETIAVDYAGRGVKLYIVDFTVGPKQIKCTGTDFDPRGKADADERMFTLHECKIHGSESDFRAQYNNLDYGFLNHIGSDFRTTMKKNESQVGSGNISFKREKSEYVIISY